MSSTSMEPSAPTTTLTEGASAEITTTIISTLVPTPTPTVYSRDPYLDYQPSISYSLPMQFLFTGVVLSLSVILLVHLVFTAPYHWPLAKLNYGLQLSGVISLLLSLGITLSVIFVDVVVTSREWPYMLNYIAVNVPLQNWTQLDNGWWYTLDAVTSGLAHTTHIQFLTILYPSSIEERLIFGLLGPLALFSSLSSFLSLSPEAKTRSIADSAKNICNSTLSILFSVALWLWGFMINRKEAWRTDGGTAIFGGGAIALSLVSIALNLYQIARVPPVWLPPLLWAIVLWQSFLGWWWYVGSAAPEPQPRVRHRKGKKKHKTISAAHDSSRLSSVRDRLGLGVDGLRRRRSDGDGSSTELNPNGDGGSSRIVEPPASTVSSAKTWVPPLGRYLPASVRTGLQRLRQAHKTARELQAVGNEQKRFEVYGYIDRNGEQTVRGVPGNGWGLGSFAVNSRRPADAREGRRLEEDREQDLEMDDLGTRSPWGDEEEARNDQRRGEAAGRPALTQELGPPQSSWSWRGPFQRWRLRDATIY